MTEHPTDAIERVQKWLDGGCSSWGLPAADIRTIMKAAKPSTPIDEHLCSASTANHAVMPLEHSAVGLPEGASASGTPIDERLENLLSEGRMNNPYKGFTDSCGCWNEGFCTAWEIVRAAINVS